MESDAITAGPAPAAKDRSAAPGATSGPTPGAVPTTLFILILLTQLPGAMTLTVTAPLLAQMGADLSRPDTGAYMIKLITGVVAPSAIVGSPLAGWLSDRFDRRPLLTIFSIIFIAAALAPAFLERVEAIVVSRFIAGASAGALSTIGMAMVGHFYDAKRRPSVIGMLAFLTLTTSILMLPIAGALAASGWRTAFYLFLALLPTIPLALLRPLPAVRHEIVPTTAAGTAPRPGGRFAHVPLALVAIACVSGLCMTLPGILYSFYFTELGVKSVGTISLFLMYQAIIGGGLTLAYGKVSTKLSGRSIFIVCLTCAALGLGIQGLTGDYRIAAASLTFTGIAMGWLVPNTSTVAIALIDRQHLGATLGGIRALSATVSLIGISDPVQNLLGVRGTFLTSATLCALVMICLVTNLLPLRTPEPQG